MSTISGLSDRPEPDWHGGGGGDGESVDAAALWRHGAAVLLAARHLPGHGARPQEVGRSHTQSSLHPRGGLAARTAHRPRLAGPQLIQPLNHLDMFLQH